MMLVKCRRLTELIKSSNLNITVIAILRSRFSERAIFAVAPSDAESVDFCIRC